MYNRAKLKTNEVHTLNEGNVRELYLKLFFKKFQMVKLTSAFYFLL